MQFYGAVRFVPVVAALLLAVPARAAGTIDDLRIDGNVAEADFAVNNSSGTLTIRFESVAGLTEESLALSVGQLDPESMQTLQRLMPGVSIPMNFPVQIRIDPPADGGLSFRGVVTVEIYTHDLTLAANSPFRLLSAPHDGTFEDVTHSVDGGSIRPRTTKPDFSDFVIGIDKRPLSEVVEAKFLRLAALLDEHESLVSPELHGELESLCSAAAEAYASEAIVPAIQYLEEFNDRVIVNSGTGVPDVWRASGDLVNVAGSLRATADTLHYSLTLVANHAGPQSGKDGKHGKPDKTGKAK
jgi:hypothetical protein